MLQSSDMQCWAELYDHSSTAHAISVIDLMRTYRWRATDEEGKVMGIPTIDQMRQSVDFQYVVL